MVSACAYSGAYPTGYGRYDLGTEGLPSELYDRQVASGFTHFQQSGTGAIRKYYNYFRVTPMLQPLDDLGQLWDIVDESAEPGYYAATLDSGIRAEITVGPKSAVHRYTFPAHRDARLVIDFSLGGLTIPHGRTVPLRAHLHSISPGIAQGEIVVEGAPLAIHVECDDPRWRQMLWYDRRLMPGGTRLDFDRIRPTTLRPFGLMWAGPSEPGQVVELRFGFSLRGVDQARENLELECGPGPSSFATRRAATAQVWQEALGKIRVDTASTDKQTVFSTALYHSLIKPCLAPDESPFWPADGPFTFDIATMWDIYRTQLPAADHAAAGAGGRAGQRAAVHLGGGGQPPHRVPDGPRRRPVQPPGERARAHVPGRPLPAGAARHGLGLGAGAHAQRPASHVRRGLPAARQGAPDQPHAGPGVRVLVHVADRGARRRPGCSSSSSRPWRRRWINAFDEETGLLQDSTYYEGGRWNYSFRLLHDMAARIKLSGGDDAFVAQLDQFFGFGAAPVIQPGLRPGLEEMAAGYALNRFEGLNNEPDMEAPWSYHYAGRPDRTAEVVQAIVQNQFGVGRGGLPGNDDSGGLSSWFVWASLGLFPVAGQNLFLISAPAWRESSHRRRRPQPHHRDLRVRRTDP